MQATQFHHDSIEVVITPNVRTKKLQNQSRNIHEKNKTATYGSPFLIYPKANTVDKKILYNNNISAKKTNNINNQIGEKLVTFQFLT